MWQAIDKLKNTLTNIETNISLGYIRLGQEHSDTDYDNINRHFQYFIMKWNREQEQKKVRKLSSLHRNKDNITTEASTRRWKLLF